MTQLDPTQDSANLTNSSKKTISPTLAAIIGFIFGVVLTSMLSNWQDVKEGWEDGAQGKTPRYETKPMDK
jgi:hypothetical protein